MSIDGCLLQEGIEMVCNYNGRVSVNERYHYQQIVIGSTKAVDLLRRRAHEKSDD